MEYLSIGQMATLNGISVRALHHYQDMGIIEPAYVDPESNRRYYDIRQSAKLDLIQQLQSIGCSLEEISELNEGATLEELQTAINRHLGSIDRQIESLQAAKRTAQALSTGCSEYLNRPILNQILLERLPDRPIVTFSVSSYSSVESNDHLSQWEQAMHETKQQFVEAGFPLYLFHDLGSFLPIDSIIAGAPHADRTFVFLDENTRAQNPERASLLPGGTHLTIYSDQAYDEEGHNVTLKQVIRLLDYARAKHLEPSGDAFGESLCRFPHLLRGTGEMLCRICMPVKTPPPTFQGGGATDGAHPIGRRIAPSPAQGSPGRLH